MWRRFCEGIGSGELAAHADYQDVRSRRKHKEQLRTDMEAAIADLTAEDLVQRLNKVGVPCGPINNIGQGFDNEQAQFLKMRKPAPHKELGDVGLIRSPINLSNFPHSPAFHHAAPDPGENADEVLAEFGLGEAAIAELKESGAVG